jgi:hypothetical protein
MQQPMQQPSQGGGFLRNAASTAAGVAGGALLFQGISSMFSGGHHGGLPGGDSVKPTDNLTAGAVTHQSNTQSSSGNQEDDDSDADYGDDGDDGDFGGEDYA